MEREITKGYQKEQLKQFRIGQATAIAEIAMNTSSALMKSVAGSWVTVGQPWFGIITALGALQAGLVLGQKPPSFEKGGLVGGQRHSQGGTMIEAERGEFVMSRNAVQSIGTETLSQINQGGGAGTQTAALASGGSTGPSTTVTAVTEAYDGTSWATNPSMGTARYYLAGAGTQTAALATGGTTVNPSPPPNFRRPFTKRISLACITYSAQYFVSGRAGISITTVVPESLLSS